MSTIDVKDADGDTVALEKPLTPGQKSAALSRPVALSTEDRDALNAILAKLIAAPATAANQATEITALGALGTKLDTLHGDIATTLAAYIDGLEALVGTTNSGNASILAKLIATPATEGKQDAAIVQETAINTILGTAGDAASTTTTIKAALRGIATALGITALDLGSGTGGSRTLRFFRDTAQWIGGNGSVTSATQRVTIADISAGEWETVAASATDQPMGATGAAGDFLAGVLIVPATTSPGAVSIKDGAGSAITIFAGGANSVSNLASFYVPLGIISLSGAWKITTGTNVSALGTGNFT